MDIREMPAKAVMALLLTLFLYAGVSGFKPTLSMLSDQETASLTIAMGEWDCNLGISRVYPDWGPCESQAWPVFVYGKGFGGPCSVELASQGEVVQAEKAVACNETIILAVFDMRGAAAADYDVRVMAENGTAVLERGFRLGSAVWNPTCLLQDTAAESGRVLDVRVTSHGSDTVHLVIEGLRPEAATRAFLVAFGQIVEGAVHALEAGALSLDFDMAGTPLAEYDLVVTTAEGFNLIVENAVGPADRHRGRIDSVDPSSAAGGERVEVRISCENVPADARWFLVGDGFEAESTAKRVDAGVVICLFDLDGAQPGICDIAARLPNGTDVVLSDCFTVYEKEKTVAPARPPLTAPPGAPADGGGDSSSQTPSASPNEGRHQGLVFQPVCGSSGGMIEITIFEGPFFNNMQVRLTGENATAWSVECKRLTPTRLRCRFNLHGMPDGAYRMEILDYQGCVVYEAGYFEVF